MAAIPLMCCAFCFPKSFVEDVAPGGPAPMCDVRRPAARGVISEPADDTQ